MTQTIPDQKTFLKTSVEVEKKMSITGTEDKLSYLHHLLGHLPLSPRRHQSPLLVLWRHILHRPPIAITAQSCLS